MRRRTAISFTRCWTGNPICFLTMAAIFLRVWQNGQYNGLLGGTEETHRAARVWRRHRAAGSHFLSCDQRQPHQANSPSNRHAVVQSRFESYMRFTNRSTNGKRVTVFGYGAGARARRPALEAPTARSASSTSTRRRRSKPISTVFRHPFVMKQSARPMSLSLSAASRPSCTCWISRSSRTASFSARPGYSQVRSMSKRPCVRRRPRLTLTPVTGSTQSIV